MTNIYGQISISSFVSFMTATQNTLSKWSDSTYAVNVKDTTCAIIFKFMNDNLQSTGLWSYKNKKFLSGVGDDKNITLSQNGLENILNAMTFWIEKAQVEKKPARKPFTPFKKVEKLPLNEAQTKFFERLIALQSASVNDEFTSKFTTGIIDMINKVGGGAKLSDKQKEIVLAKFTKYGV
jgi:hypothetical protein